MTRSETPRARQGASPDGVDGGASSGRARVDASQADGASPVQVTHEADDADRDADARALASTLRLRILRLCLDESLTNREIAARLGKNPATVLHHVRTLVDRGFLAAQPVRRGTRGAREVPYLATRRSWRARRLPGQSRILIDTFLEEVALVDPDEVVTTRLGLRLDQVGYDELVGRIQTVLEEFAARTSTPGGTPYSVFFALHEDVTRDAPVG